MSAKEYYVETCAETGKEFLRVKGRDTRVELTPELQKEMRDYLKKLEAEKYPLLVLNPDGNVSIVPTEKVDDQGSLTQMLLHCLFEEYNANGGHFTSPDTDLWFKQLGDFSETTTGIFKRLLKNT